MFIDETSFRVSAGDGGNGCVAFRREKFVPRGGPSGGDGGKGGDIVLEADEALTTLLDLNRRRHVKAKRGQDGQGSGKTGRSGNDIVLRVPAGTLVFDADSGEQLGDLTDHKERLLVAEGGNGGWGNQHFATPTRQAPDFAKPGFPGDSRNIRLELRLLADVGIVGFPSVGKSTLISRISNARPKVAEYPFTTLAPNLGLVQFGDFQSFVVADMPGLIEGAHEGKGLGHRFLRHLSRVRVLVHLLEVPLPGAEGFDTGRSPLEDYAAIRAELEAFDPAFATLPEIVALNKIDLPNAREAIDELEAHFKAKGQTFVAISAATNENVRSLVNAMGHMLHADPVDPEFP